MATVSSITTTSTMYQDLCFKLLQCMPLAAMDRSSPSTYGNPKINMHHWLASNFAGRRSDRAHLRMGDTHQTHTYELMSPGPHDLSRYMPPSAMNGGSLLSMYSAAVPCGTWNPPSIIANGMSSDAGFQCRFRWLMNQ